MKFPSVLSYALSALVILSSVHAFAMAPAQNTSKPAAPKGPLSGAERRDGIIQLINKYNEQGANVVGRVQQLQYESWRNVDRLGPFYYARQETVYLRRCNETNLQNVPEYQGFVQASVAHYGSEFCREASVYLPSEVSCLDLILISNQNGRVSCSLKDLGAAGGRRENFELSFLFSTTLKFDLSEKGKTIVDNILFFDGGNTSVDYSVTMIQKALRELKLVPRQKKNLEGFWSATDAFVAALDAEKKAVAEGKPAKPVSHRDFAAQANLLVAYYRYLKADLDEIAQFASVAEGIDPENRAAVNVIHQCIRNLINAYGLDEDVVSKQAADYGRVFVDLAGNFSRLLTETERQIHVRPLIIQVGSKIIPVSEASGDIAARDAIDEFRKLWEGAAFQAFLMEKLSATDDRMNSLILNLSNLAFKIGQTANIDIKVIDQKSVERARVGQK